MTGLTVHIPTLETERLILRAPRMADFEASIAFATGPRAAFVGGPHDQRTAMRGFGHVAGLWVTRGYSMFVAERKDRRGQPIGVMGPWHPLIWPELEFGWSLWDAEHEGHGFVTEAMRTLIPWSWERTGADTAVSFIDAGNDRSRRVAEALGATLDPDMSEAMNRPGSPFFEKGQADDGEPLTVWRHSRASWKAAA